MTLATIPSTSYIDALTAHFGAPDDDGVLDYCAVDVLGADRQGLLGLVHDEAQRGRIRLDASAEAALRTLVASAARETTLLESRAAAAIALLSEFGVETRVLKGLAVSHLDHDHPGRRQFCDVDLLVRGNDLAEAVDRLRATGFTRHFPEPYEGFDQRVGKGVAVGNDEGVVIDLHRTIALGYYGTRFPVDQLWDSPTALTIADVPAHAPPPPWRFIHCAVHFALTPGPTMSGAFDLAVLATRHPNLTTDVITALSETARCAHPVSRAILRTTDWIGRAWAPSGLVEWAERRRPQLIDRLAMAAYEGRWAGTRARSITAIAGLPGADRRFAAWAMLMRRSRHTDE